MRMAGSFVGAITEIETRNTDGNWTIIQFRKLLVGKTL
jgi:hypothetical protein